VFFSVPCERGLALGSGDGDDYKGFGFSQGFGGSEIKVGKAFVIEFFVQ